MLLIWGFKVVAKTLGTGNFHCPTEGVDRSYRHRSARRFFTFFFIPLIPLKRLGEYIECDQCKSTFDAKVLTLPTTAQLEDKLTTALRHLVVAMIRADATVNDSERTAALQVLQHHANHDYSDADLDADLTALSDANLTDHLADLAGSLNEYGKESLLTAAVTLGTADGSLDQSESNLIEQAGIALGMTKAHVRGVVQSAIDAVDS